MSLVMTQCEPLQQVDVLRGELQSLVTKRLLAILSYSLAITFSLILMVLSNLLVSNKVYYVYDQECMPLKSLILFQNRVGSYILFG